ncbi:hypothetical protein EPIR_2592 [Erwinia piriflorinigrans CFBP 5888]|uniref:Uncharacterized protein n=1 Tax=Erwinia piriflorinigrans CFBP 5888 TaxID=1161919 RepID=V5ZAK3_9GAMM|nr:hypothetical protein EPIR_2592 [Erwinia piriflorinigrans CFBP 5888]
MIRLMREVCRSGIVYRRVEYIGMMSHGVNVIIIIIIG